MRPLCLRTDFSNDYTVSIGGTAVSLRDIASMKLIRVGEDMPVKGIVESELIIRLKTDPVFEPNAAVSVSVGGNYPMSFAVHFISHISRKGDIVTIHAFDRMRMTENPFDDSLYNRSAEPFDTVLILGQLASQCGFAPYEGNIPFVNRLYFDDIHNKKCREILSFIAENEVGAWCCTNENRLSFCPFGSASCSIGMNADTSSRLYLHSQKGPFHGVYARNSDTGEIFSAGSSDNFRNMLKLQGRLMSQERANDIMSAAAEKYYRSFACSHTDILAAPYGLTEFIFPDHLSGLISSKTVVHFGGGGVYAEARAADICEDQWDYTDLTGYELRKRLEEGRKYGSTVMTARGIGFVHSHDTDMRCADVSFFSAVTDKIALFDGTIIDKTMPDFIETVSDTIKRIGYGNSVYRLSYEFDENGRKTNISFEKEEKEE